MAAHSPLQRRGGEDENSRSRRAAEAGHAEVKVAGKRLDWHLIALSELQFERESVATASFRIRWPIFEGLRRKRPIF